MRLRFPRRPRLSVVVVVYDMHRQAMNTIETLSPGYQRDVTSEDYEVVVVENQSSSQLNPAAVRQLGPNIRYVLRQKSGSSPAAAVNAGVRRSKGSWVAIAVDGARMMSPGIVANTLRAQSMGESVVAVPGYHLGKKVHQEAVLDGYDADHEQAALDELDWRADGYRLFTMAVLSASCRDGFLKPLAESNCVAVPRTLFDSLGGFDEGFTTLGGGFVNLDFYRRAVDRSALTVLPSEGSFHQFHGGATTGAPGVDRDRLLVDMHEEYLSLRSEPHAPPQRTPVLLGAINPHAAPFLQHSLTRWQETFR